MSELVKPNLGGLEQYVGYQENNIVKGDIIDIGLVFFLKVNNNDGLMSVSIERDTVELEYDESKIQEKILEAFDQFPSYIIPPFEGKEEYQWEKYTKKFGFLSIPWYRKFNTKERYYFYRERQAYAKIAMNTRRGPGNTKFGNTLFYKSKNEYDCPIIVVKKGDLYGIFKHPDFYKYGFNLKEA